MSQKISFQAFIMSLLCCSMPAHATTVLESILTAIETHPAIAVEEANQKADEYQIDAARSGYFPHLDIVQSSIGYQRFSLDEKKDPPLSFKEEGTVTHKVSNPAVVLSQTVFDGFATYYAVEFAHRQAEAAQAVVGQTREQVAYDAANAFFVLQAQQQLLVVADEIIKKHQEILDKVKKRVEGGISTVADVYQVESRLEDAFAIKERTMGQLEDAYANFIEKVGFRPDDNLEKSSLPLDCISSGVEVILTQAADNNPRIIVDLDNLKVAEAALDQTLSPFMPTIRAQLIANSPIVNPGGITGTQKVYTAQLVLDYNLFSGGRDIANLRSQQQRVISAKKRVDVTKRIVANMARSAWGEYMANIALVKQLTKAVEVDFKLQRAYELQFALVSRPLLDLLDAYVSYYRAKTDLVNAEYGRNAKQALLLATMGDLICSVQRQVESENIQDQSVIYEQQEEEVAKIADEISQEKAAKKAPAKKN